MVDISVIMPAYNAEIYLHQAIDSILNQTFKNFEFIIIDDASTDSTPKIIDSYKDPRIHPIQNLFRKGNYPSRNKGMKQAKGKYICVMDADDIAFPRRLETQYYYLENHAETSAIGSNFVFSKPEIKRKLFLSYEELMIDLLTNNSFLHPSLMIRSEVVKKQGGYNEKYTYSSDYDFMARLALTYKVENLPNTLMTYRLHESQISQSHYSEQQAYADEIRQNYQIGFINRYKTNEQQFPDRWTVGFPYIGQAIALYTYARYSGDSLYEKQAGELVDLAMENGFRILPSLGLERTLCSLGCGLTYLLRNGFVDGNEDEILTDLDERLHSLCLKWDEEEDILYGWIHYLTLRIDTMNKNTITQTNKQNLIYLLDHLKGKNITDELLLEDIRKINSLGIFSERT